MKPSQLEMVDEDANNAKKDQSAQQSNQTRTSSYWIDCWGCLWCPCPGQTTGYHPVDPSAQDGCCEGGCGNACDGCGDACGNACDDCGDACCSVCGCIGEILKAC